MIEAPLDSGLGHEFKDALSHPEVEPNELAMTPTPEPAVHSLRPVALEAEFYPSESARPPRAAWAVAAFLLLASVALFAVVRDGGRVGARAFRYKQDLSGLVRTAAAILRSKAPTEAERIEQFALEMPIAHEGHESVRGGVVFFPKTFATTDGAFDLLLHFHGNTGVVRESAEAANLNAVVAVINLGIGSGAYENAYAGPGTYEALLGQIREAVGHRVPGAHLRRLALSSWSAGYGALSTILRLRKETEPLDAILVTDGIHCGWEDDRHTLNSVQLVPFVEAARAAATEKILFSITHSEIDPVTYASASDTANYLLNSVGQFVTTTTDVAAPPHLKLVAAEGAVAKKLEKRMDPIADSKIGNLHVRSYRGNTPQHHMAHLLQMGATILPELAERWKEPATERQTRTDRIANGRSGIIRRRAGSTEFP